MFPGCQAVREKIPTVRPSAIVIFRAFRYDRDEAENRKLKNGGCTR